MAVVVTIYPLAEFARGIVGARAEVRTLVAADAEAQERFYDLLRHLHRDLGVTLVMISHDVGVIASEVTTLACLNRTLVYHGDPHRFLESDALRAVYHTGVRVVSHVH